MFCSNRTGHHYDFMYRATSQFVPSHYHFLKIININACSHCSFCSNVSRACTVLQYQGLPPDVRLSTWLDCWAAEMMKMVISQKHLKTIATPMRKNCPSMKKTLEFLLVCLSSTFHSLCHLQSTLHFSTEAVITHFNSRGQTELRYSSLRCGILGNAVSHKDVCTHAVCHKMQYFT